MGYPSIFFFLNSSSLGSAGASPNRQWAKVPLLQLKVCNYPDVAVLRQSIPRKLVEKVSVIITFQRMLNLSSALWPINPQEQQWAAIVPRPGINGWCNHPISNAKYWWLSREAVGTIFRRWYDPTEDIYINSIYTFIYTFSEQVWFSRRNNTPSPPVSCPSWSSALMQMQPVQLVLSLRAEVY